MSKGYNFCRTLHVDKNFDFSAHPFLEGITFMDEGQSQLFVPSSTGAASSINPSRYIIQSAGLVFLMNEFEKCGYSLVNQTVISDKEVGIRVMMHTAANATMHATM